MPQKIVIAVGTAAQPISGIGISWAGLNWPLGFRDLGWDVWIIENLAGDRCVDLHWNKVPAAESANVAHWRTMMAAFGFTDRSTLLIDGEASNLADLRDFAADADLFLNLSGHYRSRAVEFPRALKIYHDGDPAFSQIWAESYACDMNFAGHDCFVTVGTRFDGPDRFAPDCGIEWIPAFPPVALDYWPFEPQAEFDRFTTVAHWEGYKNVEWRDQWFCGKREEFEKILDLPGRVTRPLELAMDVAAHDWELGPFRDAGWQFRESSEICTTLESYSRYIRASSAEFTVAKGGYVLSRAGWFSDRSVCYAATGRPLVIQDTGASALLPCGEGYHPWRTPAEAAAACERVIADFPNQQRAARKLAEDYFDSRKVLTGILNRL